VANLHKEECVYKGKDAHVALLELATSVQSNKTRVSNI